LELINLNDRARYAHTFSPQILRMTQTYKTPLICMNPGQAIEPHASGTGVFYFVSGKGVMTVDGEEREVGAGDMVFVDKGQERGIRATEKLMAFAVHVTAG